MSDSNESSSAGGTGRDLRASGYEAWSGGRLDDEISLADLFHALWRRRWIVAGVVVASTALALAYAINRPDTWRYSASLRIGQMPDTERNNGRMVAPLQPPSETVTQLETAWVPRAIRSALASRDADEAPVPTISVDSPEQSRTVRLTAEAPAKHEALYTGVMQAALDEALAAHRGIYENEHSAYEARLEQARIELDKRRNETLFAIRVAAHEEKIETARNRLASLENAAEVQRTRREHLGTREELLQQRRVSLRGYIDSANSYQRQASRAPESPTQAMSLMVLADQLQALRDRLASVRETLQVDLPNERAALDKQLADNRRSQEEARARIERLEDELEGLRIEHRTAIASQEQTVRELEARAASVVPTQVLSEPLRSLQPVGVGGTVIAALGLVLGLGAGVLLALLVDAVRAPPPAHTSGQELALRTLPTGYGRRAYDWPQARAG